MAVEAFYESLGRRVEEVRRKQALTQEQLGDRLSPKMTRAAISNMERGRQRVLVHVLVNLAQALNTDVADLLPTTRPQVEEGHDAEVHAELARKLPHSADKVAERMQALVSRFGATQVRQP
jgi:transcriptional regulator with XRE-family HTH domain